MAKTYWGHLQCCIQEIEISMWLRLTHHLIAQDVNQVFLQWTNKIKLLITVQTTTNQAMFEGK